MINPYRYPYKSYNKPISDVLNIEAIKHVNSLDIVSDNLDASLSYESKETLINLLITYVYSAEKTEDIPYEFEIRLINTSKYSILFYALTSLMKQAYRSEKDHRWIAAERDHKA